MANAVDEERMESIRRVKRMGATSRQQPFIVAFGDVNLVTQFT